VHQLSSVRHCFLLCYPQVQCSARSKGQNAHCAHDVSRHHYVGSPQQHIWNSRTRFAYSLHNFYGATINSSLHMKICYRRVLVENFLSPKTAPKVAFWGFRRETFLMINMRPLENHSQPKHVI